MLAALLLVLALLPTVAQAQIYRWVDDAGAVHYSQSLDSIPERYRSQARSLDLGSPRPAPAPAERPPSSPPSLGPAVSLPSPPRARWGPSGALPEITRVSFPRGSYILVEARINGQGPVKLLLDTGSHQTHVSVQAVRTLGISAPSYPCRSCEVELTGETRVVREVQVLSLRVGDAEMTGPAFMDETDSHERLGAVGVLGRSFLDNFRVTMDFRQQAVALVPATIAGSVKHDPGVAATHVTRITFPPHPYILVSGTVNGRGPITLVLDTGAPNTWLSAKALRSLGISTENAERQTLPGRNVRAVRVDVASVEVGAAKVGPLRIGAFVEMETVAGADGLLGLDFLKNFTVTIDPTERVVTLERSDTTRPREPVVAPGRPGDPQVPSAMPPQLERWSLLGLAALVALGLGALRIVRRRRAGSLWAARQGHLTCPQCSARLTRLVDGQGIEVNWCESCKGTWHDKGILDEFSREGLGELLQGKPLSSQYPSGRRCPRCDVPMEKSAFGAEKFVVERCRSCQGLWLGRGEVAKLSQPSTARPQPAIACPRCGSALEERAGPEGVVVAVCRQCWGVWYDGGEFSFLASRHGELKGLLDRPALQGKVSAARCPRCEGPLEEGGLGPDRLRVERCQNCAGVWLAAAETGRLDEIIARRRPPVGRTSGPPDGLIVYFSRTKVAFLVLGLLSFFVLGAAAVLFDSPDWPSPKTAQWWDMAWAVFVVALIGLSVLFISYRVCRRRLALIVNREGIVDNTTPFSVGMIRWAEIAELLVQGSQQQAQLTLWIVPKRSNPKSRLRDIHIPQTALRMSPGMFVQEIRRYCPETVQIHWKP